MKSYGIYSILVALMASSCGLQVAPRSVAGEGKSYSSDGFALAGSVTGYSLHAESEYASGVPQTGAKDEFEEADRGNVLILQYRTSGSPVSGGVAKLEKDGTGADTIPDACVGQAACPEAGIYNPNPIRGSVAIRIPATGSLKKFKIRGASDAAGLSVKEAVAGSSSGGSSSGGSSSGGSSSGGSSSGGSSSGGSSGGQSVQNTRNLRANLWAPGTTAPNWGLVQVRDSSTVSLDIDGATPGSYYTIIDTTSGGNWGSNGTYNPSGNYFELPAGQYEVHVYDGAGVEYAYVLPLTVANPDIALANSITASVEKGTEFWMGVTYHRFKVHKESSSLDALNIHMMVYEMENGQPARDGNGAIRFVISPNDSLVMLDSWLGLGEAQSGQYGVRFAAIHSSLTTNVNLLWQGSTGLKWVSEEITFSIP